LFVSFRLMHVERLLRPEKSDPRASNEITPNEKPKAN
jgi:hypothetical protein